MQRLMGSSDKLINEVKSKLRKEAEKGVMKAKKKLPTPSQIKDKFGPQSSCSAAAIRKSEKTYKRLKKIINTVDKILKGSEKALKAIENILKKILEIVAKLIALFAILNALISVLSAVVNAAKVLIKAAGFIVLPPNGGGLPAGPLILAKDAANIAKGKITMIKDMVKAFTKALDAKGGPREKIAKYMGYIAAALAAIAMIISLIKMIKQMLEVMFLTKLNNCATTNPGGNLSQTQNVQTFGSDGAGGVGTTPEDFLSNIGYPGFTQDNLSNDDLAKMDAFDFEGDTDYLYDRTIRNLKLQGQEEVIEKVYAANFEMLGYRRYKI